MRRAKLCSVLCSTICFIVSRYVEMSVVIARLVHVFRIAIPFTLFLLSFDN